MLISIIIIIIIIYIIISASPHYALSESKDFVYISHSINDVNNSQTFSVWKKVLSYRNQKILLHQVRTLFYFIYLFIYSFNTDLLLCVLSSNVKEGTFSILTAHLLSHSSILNQPLHKPQPTVLLTTHTHTHTSMLEIKQIHSPHSYYMHCLLFMIVINLGNV